MDWEDICKKNNVDSSFLKEFRPSAGLRLLIYGEFLAAKERLTSYQLGFNLLPIFIDNEKSLVGIYTNDIFKGKVVVYEDEPYPDFSPDFRNINSFLNAYHQCLRKGEFHHLYCLEYAIEYSPGITEPEPLLLEACWKYIEKDIFASDIQRDVVYRTAIFLTPNDQRERLLPFIQSPFVDEQKNSRIVDVALYSLGGQQPYVPAKPLVEALLKRKEYKEHFLRDNLFEGACKKKTIDDEDDLLSMIVLAVRTDRQAMGCAIVIAALTILYIAAIFLLFPIENALMHLFILFIIAMIAFTIFTIK